MEWLKKLLGDDLYNQVVSKLGDKKIIEDDGKMIPKHRFDEISTKNENLEKELKTVKESLSTTQTELEGIKTKSGKEKTTVEEQITNLTQQIADLKTQNEQKDKAIVNERKNTALDIALTEAKANPKYKALLKKEFDIEKLELDETGKIKGFADLVKPIQENLKDLFGETKFVGGDPQPGGNPLANIEMSADDFYAKEVFK